VRTASKIGIIMAEEAVLEIHMDRTAVGSMKPTNSILGKVSNM
jgi:hypothetical protein